MQNRFLLLTERNKQELLSLLPHEKDISKLADYFQNFSDSTRIKILTCLSMMNMCVNDLSSLLGINQTTISHQLKQLKDQNIVSYKRDGKILVYYLTNNNVNDMMMYAINELGWHLADIKSICIVMLSIIDILIRLSYNLIGESYA